MQIGKIRMTSTYQIRFKQKSYGRTVVNKIHKNIGKLTVHTQQELQYLYINVRLYIIDYTSLKLICLKH